MKHNLSELIAEHVESKQTVSLADLSIFIGRSLSCPNIPRAIINSFQHCGVFPIDRSLIPQMIASELPNIAMRTDPLVEAPFQLASEKLDSLEHLSGQKRKLIKLKKEEERRLEISSISHMLSFSMNLTRLPI
jgi:hypothetical protein